MVPTLERDQACPGSAGERGATSTERHCNQPLDSDPSAERKLNDTAIWSSMRREDKMLFKLEDAWIATDAVIERGNSVLYPC